MEPQVIPLAITPHDLLADLFRARQAQLSRLYPQFKEEFLQSQRKLKEHAESLKGQREEQGQDLVRQVVEQLELREYRLTRPPPKFSIKHARPRPSPPRRQECHRYEEDSRRNSQISQTGFRPYHISNFKKSLQSYRLQGAVRESAAK